MFDKYKVENQYQCAIQVPNAEFTQLLIDVPDIKNLLVNAINSFTYILIFKNELSDFNSYLNVFLARNLNVLIMDDYLPEIIKDESRNNMGNIIIPGEVISEFELYKIGTQFIGYAKVSNIKASTLVPKTDFANFDIFKTEGIQKKWKEFLLFSQKNSSYFLMIIVENDVDFKLFYDYFKTSYEVLTEKQYLEF